MGELHRLLTWEKHALLPPSNDGAQNNLWRRASDKRTVTKTIIINTTPNDVYNAQQQISLKKIGKQNYVNKK